MRNVIKLLIVFGLLLDIQFIAGCDSSLIEVIKKGDLNSLEKILELSKASINDSSGSDYATPLMLAVRNNREDMVELLLKAGANPYITPRGEHNTALRESVMFGFDQITILLLKKCYDRNYVRCANFPNSSEPYYNKQSVWNLENDKTNYERSLGFALIEAVKKGRKDLITTFYEKGANLNILSYVFYVSPKGNLYPSQNRTTALIEAVKNNDKDTAELLLSMGADINLGPINGFDYRHITTPLTEAVKAGSIDMVQMLLAKGADHCVGLELGVNLLDIAEDKGYFDIYYLILNSTVYKR